MRRTSRLVLLAGIFLAVLTFVVFLFIGRDGTGPGIAPTPTPPPQNLPTVVAAVDIPLGTVLTADMLTVQTLPVTARGAGALQDPSQAIGQTVDVELKTGQQVTTGAFLVRDVELSVPPGRRAFAISVNELTGVGNLVETGDTIDVIISLRGDAFPVVQILNDGSISVVAGINPLSVKLPLLLQDVQIIATIDPPPPPPITDANGNVVATAPPQFDPGAPRNKLLVLSVTPAQAEVLLFARASGTLDVILRSPADAGITEETTGVILKTLVDLYGVLPPELIQVTVPTPAP